MRRSVRLSYIPPPLSAGYTPTDWDNHSKWKEDDETFLFSLTKGKIFPKNKDRRDSIYCGINQGPWFPYIGFRGTGKKNMTQGEFICSGDYFKEYIEIIPNEKKNRFFDVEEVEVYKIYK